MKKFLFKLFPYVFAIFLLHLILGSYADGNTDNNYRHFTSQAENIIFGDSRGAQAINPYVLDEEFPGKTFDNFALNIVNSPYGEIYLNAFKRKLKPDTKGGIFIFTVNPWNVSLSKDITEKKDFPEAHSPLESVHFYNWNPNYEYLLKNFSRTWFHIYRDREAVGKSNAYLHKNGWMEVTVNMNPDSIAVREKAKMKDYIAKSKKNVISDIRLKALEEMIVFAKKNGAVYLVRIPAAEKISNLEENTFPEFDKIIEDISKKYNAPYFNFIKNNKDYSYTDGNHIYKESGKELTKQVADSIKKYQKK